MSHSSLPKLTSNPYPIRNLGVFMTLIERNIACSIRTYTQSLIVWEILHLGSESGFDSAILLTICSSFCAQVPSSPRIGQLRIRIACRSSLDLGSQVSQTCKAFLGHCVVHLLDNFPSIRLSYAAMLGHWTFSNFLSSGYKISNASSVLGHPTIHGIFCNLDR